MSLSHTCCLSLSYSLSISLTRRCLSHSLSLSLVIVYLTRCLSLVVSPSLPRFPHSLSLSPTIIPRTRSPIPPLSLRLSHTNIIIVPLTRRPSHTVSLSTSSSLSLTPSHTVSLSTSSSLSDSLMFLSHSPGATLVLLSLPSLSHALMRSLRLSHTLSPLTLSSPLSIPLSLYARPPRSPPGLPVPSTPRVHRRTSPLFPSSPPPPPSVLVSRKQSNRRSRGAAPHNHTATSFTRSLTHIFSLSRFLTHTFSSTYTLSLSPHSPPSHSSSSLTHSLLPNSFCHLPLTPSLTHALSLSSHSSSLSLTPLSPDSHLVCFSDSFSLTLIRSLTPSLVTRSLTHCLIVSLSHSLPLSFIISLVLT